MDEEHVVSSLVDLIFKAETTLPEDVIQALQQAIDNEKGIARIQLENMVKNARVAQKTGRPICQDTGVQTFFVTLGEDFPYCTRIKPLLIEAVKIATESIPLRPNTFDIFTKEKYTDNIGDHIPAITWDFTRGKTATITAVPKGGGSENMSKLVMLSPGLGLKGIKDFVIREMIKAGGNPCPPTVVGVGVGGGADVAMNLAKLALLRPVGNRHSNQAIAQMEQDLIKRINETGIGPMGLGGITTVLDVHIEHAPRHPASLPVGLVVQCWADRRATMSIDQHGHCVIQ